MLDCESRGTSEASIGDTFAVLLTHGFIVGRPPLFVVDLRNVWLRFREEHLDDRSGCVKRDGFGR